MIRKFLVSLKKNPQVKYLHFWLADAINNHCECAECQKKIPSDFYVMMLNELDEKLTAAGLDTKIVFLLYLDLMFPPETETIKNPDRFTLMYAKSRKYNKTMVEDLARAEELPELKYERNKVDFGGNGAICVNFLKKWQQVFGGDSFSFDYSSASRFSASIICSSMARTTRRVTFIPRCSFSGKRRAIRSA